MAGFHFVFIAAGIDKENKRDKTALRTAVSALEEYFADSAILGAVVLLYVLVIMPG